ncbi:hypothetical protein BFP72_08310 [Reichenbachiella sp. 5M10]|nr:hypothetical protein BFP72_08310 [Reichenbachiella sp. 5M10]
MPFNTYQKQKFFLPESSEQFEGWMQRKINNRPLLRLQNLQADQVYTIPVVVHILHQGENTGTGSNIPDEQIFSQIETLNEDFRRLNADATDTPNEFLAVAADVHIEFVLAQRDPEGLPTNGITHTQAQKDVYGIYELADLAAEKYWDSDQYFNIWVSTLNDFLGYAQFPISNLEGMNIDQNTNAVSDGIFIDYRYFGTGYNADDFSKGRTVTHETGHWLGLRHIWGDASSCSADDYCIDTPSQRTNTYGCPIHGEEVSCDSNDMFQNYMDYTDDVCMNLFTLDQKSRMRTVLENSPRRKSLLTSPALTPAIQVANDLGVYAITSPLSGECQADITPTVVLKNYGTNDISQFKITLLIDDLEIETLESTQVLTPLSSADVTFAPLNSFNLFTTFTYRIDEVNHTIDGNDENNCEWIASYFAPDASIPTSEDFTNSTTSYSSTWQIKPGSSWEYQHAPSSDLSNEAIALLYAASDADEFGTQDYLISPALSMIGVASAELQFDYAYAAKSDIIADGLAVYISTDCGATFPLENRLFQRWSPNLGTTSATNSDFEPSGAGDWETVSLNLSQYTGEDQIVLAFVGYNGNGNNLYLDNLKLISTSTTNYDISIQNIEGVPVVSCTDNFDISAEVKNYGYLNLTSFEIRGQIGDQIESGTVTHSDLSPGESMWVTLEFEGLAVGEDVVTIDVYSPNGQEDESPDNNNLSTHFIIDDDTEGIPIRLDFLSNSPLENWNYYSASALQFWEIYIDDRDSRVRSLYYNAYDNINLGLTNLFVSPILTLREQDQASVRFDYSYAYRIGKNDRLQVLVSTNCGESFDDVVFDKNGSSLAIVDTNSEWFPETEDDWITETIDLSAYTGRNDIRLAFAFTNQNGNNLFIDNVEFFDVEQPDTLALEEKLRIYPNPATTQFSIKLNFNIKQDAMIRLISMNSEVVLEYPIKNALNQVYLIEDLQVGAGVYILQILGDVDQVSSRVLIQ